MPKTPDFKTLLSIDSSRLIANQAVDAVSSNPEYFKTVLNLCFTEKYPISMRAARIISLCNLNNPSLIIPYIDKVIEKIATTKIDGVKRGLLKTLKESVNLKTLSNSGKLLSICFEMIMNTKEAVAIRYYCIEIITKICSFEPELKKEFLIVLENISQESKIGISKLAKKTIKQIQKQ